MEQAVSDLNEYLGYKGDDAITCTIEGPKDENGVDEQVNILDMVLTENPVVVCLSAVDMSSCEAQLEAAQEDGIPVVMLDSGVKSDEIWFMHTVEQIIRKQAKRRQNSCVKRSKMRVRWQ